ncbi:hypothetical protein ACFL1N_16650 [Thermodesulfobacteriota bacterium]
MAGEKAVRSSAGVDDRWRITEEAVDGQQFEFHIPGSIFQVRKTLGERV